MAEETTKRKSERRSKATANILEEQGQKHHKGDNPKAKLRQSNKQERKEEKTQLQTPKAKDINLRKA